MYVAFRQKEYQPIGPKPDPIDSDEMFASRDFDQIYNDVHNLLELKNKLWEGINAGGLTRYSRRCLESPL